MFQALADWIEMWVRYDFLTISLRIYNAHTTPLQNSFNQKVIIPTIVRGFPNGRLEPSSRAKFNWQPFCPQPMAFSLCVGVLIALALFHRLRATPAS